jgi:group I intron endonuclease
MLSTTYIKWSGFLVYADNVPLSRPGIYLFKNMINEKCYVGMSATSGVASRGKNHAQRTSPKFGNAIKKYGHHNFLFIPLCYTIGPVDRAGLARLEADFIKQYDAVKNGYNVKESDELGGSCGPEFGKIVSKALKIALARPEVRANRVASLQRPEVKAKRSASQTETWQNPTIRYSRKVGLKRAWSDPLRRADRLAIWDDPEKKAQMLVGISPETISAEAKATRTQAIKLSHSRPEVKAKIAIGTEGGLWITDGSQSKRLRKGQPVPDGWYCGRSNGPSGTRWITNGVKMAHLKSADTLPEGWRYGRR